MTITEEKPSPSDLCYDGADRFQRENGGVECDCNFVEPYDG
eukprot:CAMPEP_0119566402 /NCGR_PEP_ID=MMETSP1352-20130426/32952_1 /TAXON_ID=265584 /ORGANISM="Stauroneis constricta, Strain CCMP1120" /LENGTH=40 /DNA_ID= /DNA_START= /DNA_END= /DNA_ORIENTATION=